jgi:hypothetical protein
MGSSLQHFVADKMQPHAFGRRPVKVTCCYCLAHMDAKLRPRVSLREYAFAQCLRNKASIALMGDLKNKFGHGC